MPFDVNKEKGVFFDARNGFVDINRTLTFVTPPMFDEGPVIDMPLSFDRSVPKKSTYQVIILKNFLKSCLTLVKNENDLVELLALIKELEKVA